MRRESLRSFRSANRLRSTYPDVARLATFFEPLARLEGNFKLRTRGTGTMASTNKRKSAKKSAKKQQGKSGSKKQAAKSRASKGSGKAAGTQQQPKSPMPAQHQEKPGIESKITPKPEYEAPLYKGSSKLKDKVALITGGDSGIGRGVAVLFAREGADVAIVYLPEEESDAKETQQAVEDEGRRALLIAGDVRDAEFCSDAVEQTVREFGKLDILVNNAAFQQHQKSLEDITEEQFDRTFKTNIYGYFHMAKAALKHLKKGSSIINTGSITGLEGSKELLDYSATKGAIHAFTKSLAQNLVEKGIRVNCVAPGPVWTPLNPSDKSPKDVAEFGADTPMQRPAQPEEIAPAFVYFASEADSSYVTGEVLTLLGGETTAG
ncbi:MAG TPA: SDR family oxidoreductase [Pyrinomonadaceae bacterium]|nr:SDR family oxidoreductase [Pyrinomonadaceae bacterium]